MKSLQTKASIHHKLSYAARPFLILCLSLIFAMGLVMIFSTTSAEVLDHDLNRSTHQALIKQMSYAAGGIFLAWIIYRVGYRTLLEGSPVLLAFLTLLLILVLIPGIGREVNGSRRWLSVGGLSFQPSEFVKYVLPAYFIHRFLQAQEITGTWFLKTMGVAVVPTLLIMVEPNNGTAAVVATTLLVLCFLARIPARFWGIPIACLAVLGALFAYNLPYVEARLRVYMHPELDLKGKGHQPHQAKIAAGSGQLFGKGPGNGLQKLSYLPEAQNDYIAAIYAEEFGFAGIATLILCYACVGFLGFQFALQAVDSGAFLFASAVTFLFCFQAFLNMGVVSGLLPSTGLNLPLFSQGGSSLMANIAGMGILLSASERRTVNG